MYEFDGGGIVHHESNLGSASAENIMETSGGRKPYSKMTKEERQTQNQTRMFYGSKFGRGGGAGMVGRRTVSARTKASTTAGGSLCDSVSTRSEGSYQAHKNMSSEEKMLRLEEFLHSEKKSWKELDRSTKIQKLNAYADVFAKDNALDEEETDKLRAFLKKQLENEKFKHIKDVTVDKATLTIREIPGLTYTKASKHFSLKNLEKRNSEAVQKAMETLQLSQQHQEQIQADVSEALAKEVPTVPASVLKKKKSAKSKKAVEIVDEVVGILAIPKREIVDDEREEKEEEEERESSICN